MKKEFELRSKGYSSERLEKSVLKVIRKTKLLSMATANADGTSHINTAFFCFDDNLDIYFVSDWRTNHCRNFSKRPLVALSVFDSHQRWDSSLSGLQLFGKAFATKGEAAKKGEFLYGRRFPGYRNYRKSLSEKERQDSPHRIFAFRTTKVKIFDVDEFGEETFVSARVSK